MKKYTQITFDFDLPQEESPSVGVRIKSFKGDQPLPVEETVVEAQEAEEEEIPVSIVEEDQQADIKSSSRGRMPLSAYSDRADMVNIPEREELYSKQYYSIGEVAGMFAVNASLLRYWETEFKILNPRKNKKGDRFYRPADIENIHFIFDLLRRRKLTIHGAREYMKQNKKSREKFETIQKLEEIKSFFRKIQALVK